jgi:hypothetical protein
MFSTCFRNRAKNFSSRGRSFIVPRRGGAHAQGRNYLIKSTGGKRQVKSQKAKVKSASEIGDDGE